MGSLMRILFSLRPPFRAAVISPTRGKRRDATFMACRAIERCLIAAGAVAAVCLAPGARAERLGWDSVTVDGGQSPARCRTDCTIEKRSVVTLSGVAALSGKQWPRPGPTPTIGAMIVRDSRGRYAGVSVDFRQLLIFDADGNYSIRPVRPTNESSVSSLTAREPYRTPILVKKQKKP
jgi:hypothetical protein